MQSACLKSKVKGTKDINCLPTSTSLRGWGREVGKYFTCRGNLTNSRVETENGCLPTKAAAVPTSGSSLLPSGSSGLQEPRPSCCPDYWHLAANKSSTGAEGHGPIPMGGSPWPRLHQCTPQHTQTRKLGGLHAAKVQRPTSLGGGRLRPGSMQHPSKWPASSWTIPGRQRTG